MKTCSVWLFFVVLLTGLCSSAQADSPVAGLLTAVVKHTVADGLPRSMPHLAIDLGGKRYIYRLDNLKQLKTEKNTRPGGGLAGDWAEVGVLPLDAKFHPAAQGAGWLMHRSGATWSLVASDEGVGYSKDKVSKAKVPADVIRKLKLQFSE